MLLKGRYIADPVFVWTWMTEIWPTFDWTDPLLLEDSLHEDEKLVRDSARAFGQSRLMPLVQGMHRHETFDRHLMCEFGALGLFGSTLNDYGPGVSEVGYGLICREIERVDSAFRSSLSVQSSLVMHPIHAFGSDAQREKYLPKLASGEWIGAFGLTEPNSGSDLFAAKTKATKTDGGWLINGSKIWTTSAHIADYMIAIFRTSPSTKENRRHGLTQFLVDMKKPGIAVNPIAQITGQYEFNEVVFTDHFVPDDHMLGELDGAWKQATSELAYERSGPERFLETYYVLTELVRAVGKNPDTRSAEGIGRLVAQLHTMRRMSVSVAGMLQAGKEPVVEASIVKDIGTIWEQQLPHRVRELAAFVEGDPSNHATLDEMLSFAIKTAPKLTIQGGTTEVLRGIIARGLGLR